MPAYPESDPAWLEFEAQALVETHPPRIHDARKRLIYELACPPGCHHGGRLMVSRWHALALPSHVRLADERTAIDLRPDVFSYDSSSSDDGNVQWHLNFAASNLFASYGDGAFAQDQIQVAEHPALASLAEALVVGPVPPLTVEDGEATPVLVAGVERRCRIDTGPNPAEDRPEGIYGEAFARTPLDILRRAVTVLSPPTVSNILAMAAPGPGVGPYRADEIERILSTAFTAFTAARSASLRLGGGKVRTVVHTGFWGCGKFGGDRILMTTLQVIAAVMAELDGLVIHTVAPAGLEPVSQALRLLTQDFLRRRRKLPTTELIGALAARGFAWAKNDHN